MGLGEVLKKYEEVSGDIGEGLGHSRRFGYGLVAVCLLTLILAFYSCVGNIFKKEERYVSPPPITQTYQLQGGQRNAGLYYSDFNTPSSNGCDPDYFPRKIKEGDTIWGICEELYPDYVGWCNDKFSREYPNVDPRYIYVGETYCFPNPAILQPEE